MDKELTGVPVITSAEGKVLKPKGTAIIKIQFAGGTMEQEFIVMKKLDIAIILGCDFLHSVGANIDFENKQVSLPLLCRKRTRQHNQSQQFKITVAMMRQYMSRKYIRDFNGIKIMQDLQYQYENYESPHTPQIKMILTIILAYLIKDDELDTANASKENHWKDGFSALEILQAVNRLAISDKNKQLFADYIPLIIEVIKSPQNDDEEDSAVKFLWTLSFNKKCRKILKEEEHFNFIQSKVSNNSNSSRKHSFEGIIWQLSQKKRQNNKIIRENNDKSNSDHIMLSYQWSYKPIVLAISNFLKSKVFKIWIDVESMGGSILESMAKAVENAMVVLVRYSQKYQDSPSCRSEAEYAAQKRKVIIPIKMEENFEPENWLGLILGSKLYINFSKPAKRNESFQNLLKELTNKVEQLDSIDNSTNGEKSPTIEINEYSEIENFYFLLNSMQHNKQNWRISIYGR
ncbi:DgyrCDS14462 [Dimorphilus gyrociliatus]|uniref:DgyrCDS14462 n=1 Tax=Dimorphilus gyrociliatus TaxID=2664684 RepID=A0A7I8WDN2_9ANNE|nr:DgyrCDS14462 [Dimorphilus gyrociliatus]